MADFSASQQHVLVDAKVLVSRTAFVGHSFLPEDQAIVAYIKDLLREMEVICSTGERAEAAEIHEKVKRRILAAEYFVGIFTRRHKIEGKDLWTTTDWVVQEMAFAAANKKKLVILREEGVVDFGNLQGNLEYIAFNRQELHLATIKLLQTLSSLNPNRMRIGSDKALTQVDALRIAVDANPSEPMLRVALASALKGRGMLKAALDSIDEVLTTFPDLPSAILAKAQILRLNGQHSEAHEILSNLALMYPSDANIHHELAHLFADQGNAVEAQRAFERAADCQPTHIRHLECLANFLLQTGSRNERKLKKAVQLCDEIKQIGDATSASKAEKLLIAIKSRMARLSSRNERNGRKGRPK
jgi:tetratricopeptide (TPR) repeat protein